ncbi:Uncharacterized protein APZ42_001274 [Daphnia magna]|uniref:Uncharacterized protein n=1 Tax=Daphnia magna TaxID=35525 RepID=A0A164J301_9CRUS|nr:Uncharacterized protein APZ42_001274 [Daphnia magna]
MLLTKPSVGSEPSRHSLQNQMGKTIEQGQHQTQLNNHERRRQAPKNQP